MSEITVPAVMCDDEMGCAEYVLTPLAGDQPPPDWGIATRDICTEHLCWDCVYAANDDWWIERHHYLSNPRPTPEGDHR